MRRVRIKQHDMSDCGAACLASISAYYGLKMPISSIRLMAQTDKQGTNIMGLLSAAKKLGFDAKGVKGDRESLLKVPKPAIAHVVLNNRLKHYVVVYKCDRKNLHIMDPGNGKLEKVKWEKFLKQWSGVLVILLPSESFEKGNKKVAVWERFWALLKPHKYTLVQAVFGSLVYTILGFSTSFFIQKITDHVLVHNELKLLHLMGVIMLIILGFQLILTYWKDIFILQIGQEIDARLIIGYQRHLMHLSQRFFDTMKIGEIISRIGDAMKIRMFISQTTMSIAVNLFIVLFSYLIMLSYYWKLGVFMLFMVPLHLILYIISDRLNRKSERKVMESSATLESHLVESLQGIRTIKQFGIEWFTSLRTEVKFLSLLKFSYQSSLNMIYTQNGLFAIQQLFTIGLLWLGSYYVIGQEISTGELLSFYAIIGYLIGPVSSLILSNKAIQNALIAADRLFEIIDLQPDINTEKKQLLSPEIGDIRFRGVDFAYGNRQNVLKGFTATIKAGEITAIVGDSGSGKSTLIQLLQKIYPLKKGKIEIGSIDLKYVSNQSLREKVSAVPQKTELFSGTLAENIALGDSDIDLKKILDIINQLDMEPFIDSLDNGLYSFIGENGSGLSGGQKQRITIARALYKSPDILLLDEPSSSLDDKSERSLIEAIHSMKRNNKTVILVSHRLSTVIHADRILMIGAGKLLESGSHKELISKKGAYFKLMVRQNSSDLNHPINPRQRRSKYMGNPTGK